MLSFIWLYCIYLLCQQELLLEKIHSDQLAPSSIGIIPFADKALYSSIEKQLSSDDINIDLVERQISLLRDYRPLFAPAWLQLAQLELLKDNKDEALGYARLAEQLWENRAFHIYKVASFWIKVGDVNNAIRALGRYTITYPEGVFASLHMSRLLSQNPEKMLTELYSGTNKALLVDQKIHLKIFEYALNQKDEGLAQATWEKFTLQIASNDRLVGRYLNYLVAENNSTMALKVWDVYSNTDVKEKITNNGFEAELSRVGFGWHILENDEFNWDIDEDIYFKGSKSLKLAFDGKHNIDFYHIRQTIPVQPGATYRFSGYWRGNNLSTSSTPYVELMPLNTHERHQVRIISNKKNWGWEKFEEFIEIPLQSNFITVRIRRNKTTALDKNITGKIWFDEFNLEKI